MTAETLESGFGTLADETTLVIQRWLPGPASRVWRYLTDSDLRAQWLAAGDMRLEAGAPVELVWRNGDLCAADDPRPADFPEEHRLQSRVIAVEPMTRLTIAWGAGDVTFDLREKGDRVLLTVTHRGIAERGGRVMIGAGWHMHLDVLVARVSGTPAPSFWSGWTRLRAAYDARLP
ncbi:SRPBCC family protein [Oceaniglobus roseus]|uniref:SRPBCC family protein n=1 Tax=Oceaniglobus roseus TaxID=1737570 RepID=UPI000C7E9AF2|nr:SRPBCC family protein [Kandeliimicrobium roseum]